MKYNILVVVIGSFYPRAKRGNWVKRRKAPFECQKFLRFGKKTNLKGELSSMRTSKGRGKKIPNILNKLKLNGM